MSYAGRWPSRRTAQSADLPEETSIPCDLGPGNLRSTRVEASFSCTSIPRRLPKREGRTGQCSSLAAGAPRLRIGTRVDRRFAGWTGRCFGRRAASAARPLSDGPGAPLGRDDGARQPRRARSRTRRGSPTASRRGRWRNRRSARRRPSRRSSRSRATPSSRRGTAPGTSRLSCSTVAVMVGAQSTPQTVMRTAKLGTPDSERDGRGGSGEAAEQPEDGEGPVPGAVDEPADEGAGTPEREDPADRLGPLERRAGRPRRRRRCRSARASTHAAAR